MQPMSPAHKTMSVDFSHRFVWLYFDSYVRILFVTVRTGRMKEEQHVTCNGELLTATSKSTLMFERHSGSIYTFKYVFIFGPVQRNRRPQVGSNATPMVLTSAQTHRRTRTSCLARPPRWQRLPLCWRESTLLFWSRENDSQEVWFTTRDRDRAMSVRGSVGQDTGAGAAALG